MDVCNILIVLTSNLGADILLNADPVRKVSSEVSPSTKQAVMAIVGSTYPPEVINRSERTFIRCLFKSVLRDVLPNELQAKLEDRLIVPSIEDDVKD